MADSKLFTPVRVGNLTLGHRLVQAPLTRMRADETHTHHSIAVEYYTQRASSPGTLIISEGTIPSARSGGYLHSPGCYTDTQVAAWKKIVDAVHAKGCYLFLQLYAMGRAATWEDLKTDPNGGPFDVVSASDVAFEGGDKPRPLTIDEIHQYTKEFTSSAERFLKEAGGDGVEVHFANGYLLDQFISSKSNQRTDEYGQDRLKFPLEVVDAVAQAIGADKLGVRISPWNDFQGVKMDSSEEIRETFSALTKRLPSSLAYLHVVEPRISGATDATDVDPDESNDFIYELWKSRPYFVAGGYTPESAKAEVEAKENTLVVFGRYFVSNPDLVARIRHGHKLAPYDRDTFYAAGPEAVHGYTDYPFADFSKELLPN